MPFRVEPIEGASGKSPGAFSHEGLPCRITLWPHRSMGQRGFAVVIGMTWVSLMVPLTAMLGTAALWGLLPFALATVGLLWLFLQRSFRDADLQERVTFSPDGVDVLRTEPGGTQRTWQAKPYWLRVVVHRDGPVENYLTLTGGAREIELGAFLSPEERLDLSNLLQRLAADARRP